MNPDDIESAKQRLRIPELWRLLNLPGTPAKSCRVPWREDEKPSGSVYDDGLRFHDFATGEDFDAIDFLARASGLSLADAIQQFTRLGELFAPPVPRQWWEPLYANSMQRWRQIHGETLPACYEFEMGEANRPKAIREWDEAKRYADLGGIVWLQLSLNNFTVPHGGRRERMVAGGMNDRSNGLDPVLPGGSAHELFVDCMRQFAREIKEFGRPCVLRPFHEMNGRWFWWGAQPDKYKTLWRFVFGLFKQEGVRNVIWCWAPSANTPRGPDYYPGDDMVDNHLDACVVSCVRHGLPVHLFVAVAKGTKDPNYAHNLKAAKRAGVGVIEVDDGSGVIIQNALSLSLSAVRPIDVSQFPKKYRQSLSHAEQLFRDGTPEKACSLIYDEIESLFRRVTTKTHSKGWWPNAGGLTIDTVSWANLIKEWDKTLNRSACPCPELTPALAARILGITTYRNESGHKPKNQKALIKRDQQLRTRFENATDLFRELVEASKPLKV